MVQALAEISIVSGRGERFPPGQPKAMATRLR
jgi:hypothetical protein